MNNNNKRVNSMEGVQVGDQVWSLDQGWGTVLKLSTSDTSYPIRVEMENGTKMSYTIDGYNLIQNKTPSLFFDEIPVVIPKRPKEPPKRGDPVYVRDYLTDDRKVMVFSHINSENKAVTLTIKYSNGEYSYSEWEYWEEFEV